MTIPRLRGEMLVVRHKTLSMVAVATKVGGFEIATQNLSFALPPVLSFNVACITAMACSTSALHIRMQEHCTMAHTFSRDIKLDMML